MASTSSMKKDKPKLQSIFGLLTPSEDYKIREIFERTDALLLEFANYFGRNQAGWEGTGLELMWFPSGQVVISSFVGTGLDGNHRVDFLVSLQPTWIYDDFPTEQGWQIDAEIEADCQHTIYCGNMHIVHQLPSIIGVNPIEAANALHNITIQLIQLGKEKPIEYWLKLAGDS